MRDKTTNSLDKTSESNLQTDTFMTAHKYLHNSTELLKIFPNDTFNTALLCGNQNVYNTNENINKHQYFEFELNLSPRLLFQPQVAPFVQINFRQLTRLRLCCWCQPLTRQTKDYRLKQQS